MPDPACQRLFSLQHYDRVSRDAPTVRRIDRGWSGFPVVKGLKAELTLPAPRIALPDERGQADVLDGTRGLAVGLARGARSTNITTERPVTS